MKFLIILMAFLLGNLRVISQTKQTTTSAKSQTSKTTKGTDKKIKPITNSHSGPGIENTGTTDIDVKDNIGSPNKSDKTKLRTHSKTTVTKSSGTKKNVQ